MKFSQEAVLTAAREGARKYASEQLEVLCRLCAIDCGSRNEEGNARVVEIIDGLLSKIEGIGIEHHYAPGYGTHIVAKLTPEHPTGKIILNAHTDTVFKPGDAAKYPPHTEGDTGYGLGIADCKGGILVAIYAVRMMQEQGLLPDKEICFIFNCDEEIGSPSGKGVFDRELPGADMAFVFEPSRLENGVLTARKGTVSITVDVTGRQAHSGINYSDGRSAILEAAHRMLLFYESNLDDRGIQFNVGPVVNDDPVNIVSGHATVKLGVRVANQADIDTVREIAARTEAAEPYIPDTVTRITIDDILVPMERTEGNRRVYEIVRDAGRLLGQELPEQSTGGSGDASYFSYMGCPTADALGPYMYKVHTTDESMRLSSVEEKTRLFSVVLGTLK